MTTPANPFAGKVQRATWSGASPPEDRDGITPEIAESYLTDPHRIRIQVMLTDCVGAGSNFDREEWWPIVRKRHVEVIVRPEDVAVVSEILGRAWGDRLGRDQLDLGLVPGEVAAPPESPAEKKERERDAAAAAADREEAAAAGGTVHALRPGDGSGRQ